MRFRTPARVALTVPLLLLASCGANPDEDGGSVAGFPMTVSDCGRDLTIDGRPERVLTMGSTAALLVWAAGAADQITTRAYEGGASLGPAEDALSDVPQISPDDDLSREVIIGEDPDLVVTFGLNLTTAEDLEAVGIDSIVNAGFCDGEGSGPNPDGDVDFDDVYRDIELYGRLLGTENVAAENVRELRARVAEVKRRVHGTPELTGAALALTDSSVSAYGRENMTHTQLETLGITDVFADVEERVVEINVEELISRDPDVLVLLADGAGAADQEEVEDALQALPGIDGVTAVREDRVILLEAPYMLGSPLAVDGLEEIAMKVTAGS